MVAWRMLAGVGLVLTLGLTARAQNHVLREAPDKGACYRVEMSMTLQGEIKFRREGKDQGLPLSATAEHVFSERVLSVTATGSLDKTARVYEKATATMQHGRQKSERSLRPGRSLIVAQRPKDATMVYCPKGALFRSELELTGQHLDTLAFAGLLPGKEVALGETWKVGNLAAQALCLFEGLTEHTLTAKLEEVKDGKAKITVSGTANGIDAGSMAKLTVQATAVYDVQSKTVVQLDWQQKDEREQGPVSPASAVSLTTTVKRQPISQPESLNDVALVSVPNDFNPPPQVVQLDLVDPRGRYEVLYGRNWHIVGQNDEHVVMRLMDRGDFLAQVTITPWTNGTDGKRMTADEFKEAIGKTPGWEPEKELQAGEVPSGDDRWIYRQSLQGKLDGLEVVQNCYVVAAKDGRQVVMVFTMTPKQAERLGTHDLSLVGSLDFPPQK